MSILSSVLKGILIKRHIDNGLELYEDEDYIYMTKHGHTIAIWSSKGATVQEIWNAADKACYDDTIQNLIALGAIEIKRGRK